MRATKFIEQKYTRFSLHSRAPVIWPWILLTAAWTVALLAVLTKQTSLINHSYLLTQSHLVWIVALVVFLACWQVMILAMMLPSSMPLVCIVVYASRRHQYPWMIQGAFLAGYALVWTAFACVALLADTGVHWLVNNWFWLYMPSLADNDKKSAFGGMMSAWLGIALFVIGVLLAVWATERLLEGLVGLSVAFRLSAFAVGAVLSGFEVENVAVGLAAGARGTASVALGTVFGGAIFLVCVALGVGVVLYPLEIRLPRGVLLVFATSPLLVGLSLIAPITPRWTGAILLIAFVAAMIYLIQVSRHQNFLVSGEVREEQEKQRPLWIALLLTLVGIVVIGIGGELVAQGAQGIITALGVPALFMGMIVSPAAIELEEVIRQAVPAKEGRPDVSAGNLVGTLLYFLLFNLGLIALLTPVEVDPLVRQLDWPFLVVMTLIAAAFLWRGRVGRSAGVILLVAYALSIVLHIVLH